MAAQDLLIVAVAVVAAGVWAASNLRGRGAALREYWARSCSGRAWKRAFPGASKGEIRAFLHLFVDAFAFPRNRALQFLPSDRVLAVYRALYPSSELPDALEVETLAKQLSRTYRVSLGELWGEELTLGQLFNRCRVPAA
jgi:hypothetical protein